jgi:hypothetical protein
MSNHLPRRPGLLVFSASPVCLAAPTASPAKIRRLSPTSQALASEADTVAAITSEEDFFEAKLLYQALPENAGERARLRGKLLDYLLAPIAALDAEQLRRRSFACSGARTISIACRTRFATPWISFRPAPCGRRAGRAGRSRTPAPAEGGEARSWRLLPARQRAARGHGPVRALIGRWRQSRMGVAPGPALPWLDSGAQMAAGSPDRDAWPRPARSSKASPRFGPRPRCSSDWLVARVRPPGQGGRDLAPAHRLW